MSKNKNLTIISYNLRYHKANRELSGLVNNYQSDVLCIQECFASSLPKTIGHLQLADKTTTGKFNLAIYYDAQRFSDISTQSHALKKSFIERLYMPHMERLLVSKMYDLYSKQYVTVGSFHATHHVASNYLRRIQIEAAHRKLSELCANNPTIMVGDYNYALFKKRLKIFIESSGYELTKSDMPTYYMNKFLGMHFDLTTSINTKIQRVSTLPKGLSDHSPILIQAII